ncbi:MAG: hypothetical protein ACLVK0_13800 [Parabacteroides merdae]
MWIRCCDVSRAVPGSIDCIVSEADGCAPTCVLAWCRHGTSVKASEGDRVTMSAVETLGSAR